MTNFIKIEKDGEIIEVHPDALADHKSVGWVEVVEVDPVVPEKKAEPKSKPAVEKKEK